MNDEKIREFVDKIAEMTTQKSISWQHYKDGDLNIKDDNFIFFHSEFCMLDSKSSYYTRIDRNFIILALEKWEDGKDARQPQEYYRLLVGEEGKHGFISQLPFNDDPYAMLSELSYYIKDSINDSDEKAAAFVDSILNNDCS